MNRTESFTAFVGHGGGMSLVAHSTVHLVTPLPLLARFEGAARWRRMRSDNRRALSVTGAIHLPWLQAEIVFRRQPERGAPRAGERRYSTVVVPGDLTLPIPPQCLDVPPEAEPACAPALRAAPHIPWTERGVTPPESESIPLHAEVALDATLDARFTPRERLWSREVAIEFVGEIRFDRSVRATLEFETPASKVGAHKPSAEIVLVVAGARLPISSREVTGLFVPNPWISVRFLDGRGQVAGKEYELGRSVRIA